MGYAARKGVARITEWRDFTYEEAMYVIDFCKDMYEAEKAEADKAG